MTAPVPRYVTSGSLKAVIVPALSVGVRTVTLGPETNTVHGPKTTRDFLAGASGIFAITNGPMFDYCRTERVRTYAGYTCATSKTALHDPARGITLPGRTPDDGLTLYVLPDGSSGASRGAHWPENARVAIQFYPTLVHGGSVVQGLSNLEPNTRSAVARLSDGRFAFVVCTGLSNPQFASALAGATFDGARVTDAGYTDGSGSSALWARGAGTGTAPLVSFNTGGRRLVAWVTAEDRESVLGRLSDTLPNVTGTAGKAVLGAVILLMAGYALAAR